MSRTAMILAIGAVLTVRATAQEVSPMSTPTATGTARVNGVALYYEIHGHGEPLVMLHGGVNPSEMFGVPLAAMARSHRVIAIHLRGHGLSTDAAAPWTSEAMADDVAAVLEHLKLAQADVMGYSLGGGVALQLAIRHPNRVRRLVVISIAFKADGDYPEVRAAMRGLEGNAAAIAQHIAASPLARTYPNVNWEVVMRKTGQMIAPSHDWSAGVAKIAGPTLIIFGDADSIMLEHMIAFYQLLGGGRRHGDMDGSGRSPNQFAVIPNATHYNILSSPAVTTFALAFLAR